MRRILSVLLLLLLLFGGAIAAGNRGVGPVVITHEGTQQIILRFGDVVNETEPGLSWRVPLLDQVKTFERRWRGTKMIRVEVLLNGEARAY